MTPHKHSWKAFRGGYQCRYCPSFTKTKPAGLRKSSKAKKR